MRKLRPIINDLLTKLETERKKVALRVSEMEKENDEFSDCDNTDLNDYTEFMLEMGKEIGQHKALTSVVRRLKKALKE